MKEQRATLNRTQSELSKREIELKELKDTIQSNIGTTKYGDAVEYVSSLLQQDVLKDERDKLKLVKSCLIKGNDDDSMHIPQNLNGDEQAFIMKEYAGISVNGRRAAFGSRHAYSGPSTRNFNMVRKNSMTGASLGQTECISEFKELDTEKQTRLFKLLSFSSLSSWEFNIFDVAEIDEANTLLFVSWAVICAPYSQIAMAKELRGAGVEIVQGDDEFDGYDFSGEYCI